MRNSEKASAMSLIIAILCLASCQANAADVDPRPATAKAVILEDSIKLKQPMELLADSFVCKGAKIGGVGVWTPTGLFLKVDRDVIEVPLPIISTDPMVVRGYKPGHLFTTGVWIRKGTILPVGSDLPANSMLIIPDSYVLPAKQTVIGTGSYEPGELAKPEDTQVEILKTRAKATSVELKIDAKPDEARVRAIAVEEVEARLGRRGAIGSYEHQIRKLDAALDALRKPAVTTTTYTYPIVYFDGRPARWCPNRGNYVWVLRYQLRPHSHFQLLLEQAGPSPPRMCGGLPGIREKWYNRANIHILRP